MRLWDRLPERVGVSPDGEHYLAVARGEPEPYPFCLRWGIPRLCGTDHRRWVLSTWVGVVAYITGSGVLAFQHGAGVGGSCAAAAMVWLLPSTLLYIRMPLLVDPPMLGLAVWTAVAMHVWWPLAIPLAIAAGCVRETGPVWAAVFAFNPVPLVGLVPVAIVWRQHRGAANVGNPPSMDYHRDALRDPCQLLLPWGGLAAAAFWPSWWLALALAAGYGQLFVASDRVRLYQQCAPVLAVVVATHTPFLLPLVLASWFNPWRGGGH